MEHTSFFKKNAVPLLVLAIIILVAAAITLLVIAFKGNSKKTDDKPTVTTTLPSGTTTSVSNGTTAAPTEPTAAPTAPEKPANGRQYFNDINFERGLDVGGKQLKFNDNTFRPFWILGQNDTKFEIYGTQQKVNDDGSVEYLNDGKRLRYWDSGNGMAMQLEVFGENEYDSPRVDGQAWPHLLLGYNFSKTIKTPIGEYSSLVYNMDVKIDYADNKMDDDYDSSRHCAQTTAYFTIQNLNTGSQGYGDYVWFGVPIFDNRVTFPEQFHLLDEGGKHDATGKIIYVLGGADFLKTNYGGVNPADGEWASCSVDILPYAKKALETAQQQGHMKNTTWEDLTLGEYNIGWEVTGTFNCSMDLRNISLIGVE